MGTTNNEIEQSDPTRWAAFSNEELDLIQKALIARRDPAVGPFKKCSYLEVELTHEIVRRTEASDVEGT